jgi:hypothetical protein
MYVVNMASASALCTRALDPIDADHTEIVKPGDRNSPSYVAFKNAYITVQSELQQKTLATQTTALGNNSLVNNTGTILENEFSNNFVVNGGPDKLIITTNSGNIKNNNMSGNFIDGNVALLDNTGVIGNNQIDSNTIIPQAPFRIVDDSSPIQAPNGGFICSFHIQMDSSVKIDYLIIALKTEGLLSLRIIGNGRMSRLDPFVGYAIGKVIDPAGTLTVLGQYSKADCHHDREFSWGPATAQ